MAYRISVCRGTSFRLVLLSPGSRLVSLMVQWQQPLLGLLMSLPAGYVSTHWPRYQRKPRETQVMIEGEDCIDVVVRVRHDEREGVHVR